MEAYEVSGSEIIELMEETGEEKKKKIRGECQDSLYLKETKNRKKNGIKFWQKSRTVLKIQKGFCPKEVASVVVSVSFRHVEFGE